MPSPFKKINLPAKAGSRKMREKFWTAIIVMATLLFSCPFYLYAVTEIVIESEQAKLILDSHEGWNIPDGDTLRLVYTGIGSDPSALLRDSSGNPSYWGGTFWSNYSVLFVNTNGITFGANANIQAAAFIASTLNISNEDFLSGNYKFFKDGQNAFILNRGRIVANGGYVALLSGAVENQGTIVANLGTIVLASSEEMTLALDDLNEISVVIDKGVQDEVLGFDSAIKNSGTISANGGKVILTAKVLNKVFDYAINNTGVIEAKSILEHNGTVELLAEGAPIYNIGKIEAGGIKVLTDSGFINKGVISADGYAGLPNGGRISIEAATILQQGKISANAFEGGTAGEVSLVSQTQTTLDSGSATEAKALGLAGNGGRILINSTGGNTVVNTNAVIDVSAGAISGNAGYIEVGAFEQLGFYGVLNGRAPPGYLPATVKFTYHSPLVPPVIIITDQADYPPSGTPVISGSGFLPNQEITINIFAPDGTQATLKTVADAEGNFALTYTPASLMLGAYFVTGTDGSRSAVNTFTDAATITASASNLNPWTKQGTSGLFIFTFTVSSSAANTFKQVTVTYTGTTRNDISTIYLYYNGSSIASVSNPGSNNIVLNPANISMTANTGYTFYIVVDLKAAVPEGNTVDVRIGYGNIGLQSGNSPALNPSSNTTVDNTPPNFTTLTRTTGETAYGWNNGNITVSYTASDPTSGGVSSGIDTVGSDPTSYTYTSEGTNLPHLFTIKDKAGNTATLQVTDHVVDYVSTTEDSDVDLTINKVNIDKTAPTITGAPDRAPNGNDWYKDSVIVTFTPGADLSGIASITAPVTLSAEAANQSADGTVTDKAGNSRPTTVSGINIDKTAPTIAITSPTDGLTYDTAQTLTYKTTDALSGIDNAGAGGPLSGTVYNALGTHSIIITATDLAGNSSSTALSFTIEMPTFTESQLSNATVFRLLLPSAEQLAVYQINTFSGAVYFYHPLTPFDMSAFDQFILEEGAYQFIDGAINIIGHENLLRFLLMR